MKHAVAIIILWIVALLITLPYAGLLGGKVRYVEQRFLPEESESLKASKIVEEKFTEVISKIGIITTSDYILVVDNVNTSDSKVLEKYIEFRNEVREKKLVKNVISFYDIYVNVTLDTEKVLNKFFTSMYINVSKVKDNLVKLNESFNKLYVALKELQKFIPEIHVGAEKLDEVYIKTYDLVKELNSSLNNLDLMIEYLDLIYNSTYDLAKLVNNSLTIVKAVNNTYVKMLEKTYDLANVMMQLRVAIQNIDQAYVDTYRELKVLKEEFDSLRQQLIQLNNLLYGVEDIYTLEFFNIIRTHFYLNAIGAYQKPILSPDDVMAIQKLTNLSNLCSIEPVDTATIHLTYSYVKLNFNNPNLVREEDLLPLATFKVQVELGMVLATPGYSNIAQRYVSYLENAWEDKITELRANIGTSILNMLIYKSNNIELTKRSQCDTFNFIKRFSRSIIERAAPKLSLDIANVLGITAEEAYMMINAAISIGYPPTEEGINTVLEQYLVYVLENRYGKEVNWGLIASKFVQEGTSPELSMEIVKILMETHFNIYYEEPLNISADELIDVLTSNVLYYDPFATGILTYSSDNLKLATVDAFTQAATLTNVTEFLPLNTLPKISQKLYTYLQTANEEIIRDIAIELSDLILRKYVPNELKTNVLTDIVRRIAEKYPLSPEELINESLNAAVNLALSQGVDISSVKGYIKDIIVRNSGYVKCDEYCLRENAWFIFQNILIDMSKGKTLPIQKEIPIVLKNELMKGLLTNKNIVSEFKGLYLAYGVNALKKNKEDVINIIKQEIINYLTHEVKGLTVENAQEVVELIFIGSKDSLVNATRTILDHSLSQEVGDLWKYVRMYEPGFSKNQKYIEKVVLNYTFNLLKESLLNENITISDETLTNITKKLHDLTLHKSELKNPMVEITKLTLLEIVKENTSINVTDVHRIISALPITSSELNEVIINESKKYMQSYKHEQYSNLISMLNISYIVNKIIQSRNESVIDELVNEYKHVLVRKVIDSYLGIVKNALISNSTYLIIFEPLGSSSKNVNLIVKTLRSYYPYADVYLTGSKPINDALSKRGKEDLSLVDKLSTLLVFLAMMAVVGSLIALSLPLISFGISFTIASSIVYLIISQLTDIHLWARALLVTTTLGLGVDYSSYYILTLREEIATGINKKEATINALRRVSPAIIAAATTDATGFGVLALAWDFPFMRSMGLVIPVGIIIVMVASLTLVPAVTSFLSDKKWFWWPRKPKEITSVSKVGLKIVRKSTYVIIILAIISVISGIIYAQGFMPSHELGLFLPEGEEAIEGFKIMKSKLSSSIMYPTYVVINLSTLSDESLEDIEGLLSYLESSKHVSLVYGPTRPNGIPLKNITLDKILKSNGSKYISNDGVHAFINILLTYSPDSEEAANAVKELKELIHNYVKKSRFIKVAYVGGLTAEFVELDTALQSRFWNRVFPAAMIAMFVLMTLCLRSVIAGILSTTLVSTSALMGLALTVLVFRVLFDVHTIWFLPMVVFAVIIGVGMDYFSFYFVRARYELMRGPSAEIALAKATKAVGMLNLGLATIVSSAYGSLMISTMWVLKEVGFALSVSIFITALATAYFMLPAAMKVLVRKLAKPQIIESRKE